MGKIRKKKKSISSHILPFPEAQGRLTAYYWGPIFQHSAQWPAWNERWLRNSREEHVFRKGAVKWRTVAIWGPKLFIPKVLGPALSNVVATSCKGFWASSNWDVLTCKTHVEFQRLTVKIKMQIISLIFVIDFMLKWQYVDMLQRSQPFWRQGPDSWKTFFPWVELGVRGWRGWCRR